MAGNHSTKNLLKNLLTKMFEVNSAGFINLYTDGKFGAIVVYAGLFDTRVKSNQTEKIQGIFRRVGRNANFAECAYSTDFKL